MSNNQQLEPPKTVREIGVHLFYMRKEQNDMMKLMNGFATKSDVSSLSKKITDPKYGLAKRVELSEQAISDINDTILPLANIRKRMWSWVIGGTITFYGISYLVSEYLKTYLSQGGK